MLKTENPKGWKASAKPQKKTKNKFNKKDEQPKEDKRTDAELSPEELKARREAQRKMQEEADLQNAADLFGFTYKKDESHVIEIPKQQKKEEEPGLNTQEEFDKLADQINKMIAKYKDNRFYSHFTTTLISNISQPLPEESLRKISTSLTSTANEKQRAAKLLQKSKSKASQRSCLRMEADIVNKGSAIRAGVFDDYDDFM